MLPPGELIRPAIFWQTQKAATAANPGARIPRARAILEGFAIAIDTREHYPFRFAGRGVRTERVARRRGGRESRQPDVDPGRRGRARTQSGPSSAPSARRSTRRRRRATS
jgi:hypothetical protein